MIQGLQNWSLILSGIAVFGSLCEVILPEGSFQKYIRLGLGMILVLALLSPVKGLLSREWEFDEDWEIENSHQQTDAMEERQRGEILHVYQGNLEKKILTLLQREVPGFSGYVRCQVEEKQEEFGKIREITVVSDGKVDGERVRNILMEEYGVTEEQISLPF